MEILEKLQVAFPKSAGRFKMVSGSAHSYVVYTDSTGGQLFIDPTISQFTGKPANVFVGTLADLKGRVGTKFDNYLEYDKSIPKTGGRRKTRRRRGVLARLIRNPTRRQLKALLGRR